VPLNLVPRPLSGIVAGISSLARANASSGHKKRGKMDKNKNREEKRKRRKAKNSCS